MDIKDGLVLATLMAEGTGCSMEAALIRLHDLTQEATAAPVPEPPPAPEPQKALRPFNKDRFAAFLDRAVVGADWTAPGICEHLGMAFPAYAKHPAQIMIRRGWVAIGIFNGCRLYRKTATVVADAAQ